MSHECHKEEVISLIRDDLKEIRKDVKMLLERTAMLSVKASVWGIAGGAIVMVMFFLKKGW